MELNDEVIELVDMVSISDDVLVMESDKYKDIKFVELKNFDKLPAEIKIKVINGIDGVKEIEPAKTYGFFKSNWKKLEWNGCIYEPVKLHFATFKLYEMKAKDKAKYDTIEDFVKDKIKLDKKDGKKRYTEWVDYRKYWFDGNEYLVDEYVHRIEMESAKWLKRKGLDYYKSNSANCADTYLFNLLNGGYAYGD